MQDHHIKNQKGIAVLTFMLIMSALLLTLTISISKYAILSTSNLGLALSSRDVYYGTESAVEDTLLHLVDDPTYTGGSMSTEVGDYTIVVTNLTGTEYTIATSMTQNGITRNIQADIELNYSVPEILKKAVFCADSLRIMGENSLVRGDLWTNDDFDVNTKSVVEGDLYSGGKGGLFVNWVWDGIFWYDADGDGGRVVDNPTTTEVEGNVTAYDDIKVSGPTAYVEGDATSKETVYTIYGGSVDGIVTSNATFNWTSLAVPSFDFASMKAIAKQEEIDDPGGDYYFKHMNDFNSYLDGLSDNHLTGIYYIDDPSHNLYLEGTRTIELTGTLAVRGDLHVTTNFLGSEDTSTGYPVLASGKSLLLEDYVSGPWWWRVDYDFGTIIINGIAYAERDIVMSRNESDEFVYIDGAIWAGDDVYVEDNSTVIYNVDPLNVNGFDFGTGSDPTEISGITLGSWYEVI